MIKWVYQKIYDTGIDAAILITGHYANIEEDGDEVLLKILNVCFKLTGNIPLGDVWMPAPYKRILGTDVLKHF